MRLSKRASWLLLAFGVWSWIIWLTFLVNVSHDTRSFAPDGSWQPFFTVHLVLTVLSLIFGTAIGILGVRGVRAKTG